MARLPYPGPSYVSGVMHQFPEQLHHLNIARMLSYASTANSPSFALLTVSRHSMPGYNTWRLPKSSA
jgi:hypothetical protein